MKKIFLVLFSLVFIMFSCSTTKKANSDVAKEQESIKTEKTAQQTEKDKQKEQKQKQKQKEKELQERRKQQKKEQERLSKEAEQKKRAAEKESKKLKKEQDNLIKNAEKKEKNRIKEERKKEKEALEKSQKELTKKLKEERERAENSSSEIEDEQEEIVTQIEDSVTEKIEETTALVEDTLVNKISENIEQTQTTTEQENTPTEQPKEERELSTMDQILSMMEANPRDKSVKANTQAAKTSNETETVAISDKEKKSIIKQAGKEEKEGSFFKRMYRKVIPEKIDRDITYPNMYKEQPNTILVLYPWNRSQYDKSSEMLYVSVTKELIDKGYYVLPAMFMMDECKKDTNNLYSRYAKLSEIKNYKEKYGADAVLFVTIYRFEKPWWTTNITAVAHYNLISTTTLDTLFSRQADFNYDSQMPPKGNGKDKLIQDEKEQHYLGIMEQMQRYVFLDMPVGPYHKNYSIDQKKFSHKKEMKYKVNVKPS